MKQAFLVDYHGHIEDLDGELIMRG